MPEDQSKGKGRPTRDATEALMRRTAASGGTAIGPIQEHDQPQWAASLIQQFNDAGPKTRCRHLVNDDQVALWVAVAPDLIACQACEAELIKKVEIRLGHELKDEPGRCSACGAEGMVRGVSVAVDRYLLRGMICSACEASSPIMEDEGASTELPEYLDRLGIPPIQIDRAALQASTDFGDFEEKSLEMIARAGQLSELLIEAVQRHNADTKSALEPDEAVIGGLLVRCLKLTRAIFESAQSEESEAYATLSRCLAETTITLRWLVAKSDPAIYRRFRADSLARWRVFLDETGGDDEDAVARTMRDKIEDYAEAELSSGDLSWDDVPKKPNSWGPSARQQFEDLDQAWIYDVLFAPHSSYVHPSWHEIRAFHVSPREKGFELDAVCGSMIPVAGYLLSRLVVEACLAVAGVLKSDIDSAALSEAVDSTVSASQVLSLEFSEFYARGAIDEHFERYFFNA